MSPSTTSERQGKCSQCTNPPVEGRSRCQAHLDKANASARARNAQRKAHGMCLRCPSVAKDGHVLCLTCLDALRGRETNTEEKQRHEATKYQARKASGLCRWCDEPRFEDEKGRRTLCKGHLDSQREKVREYRTERKALGLCWRCDEPARPNGVLCQTHRDEVTRKERERDARRLARAGLSAPSEVPEEVNTPSVERTNGAGSGKMASGEAMVAVVERGYGVDAPALADVVHLDRVKCATC